MQPDDRSIAFLANGEGRSLRVFAEVMTCKVVSERTGGAYSLFEATVLPRGGVPPHIHHREDECFYVLTGEFMFTVEGLAVKAGMGSLIYVPKGTLHAYENISEVVGRMLVSQTPGGSYEKFYEEVGEEVTSDGNLEPSRGVAVSVSTAEAAARHGIEFVLPQNAGR